MGRKSKLSKEQIAESIFLIDGKKISLRKRAIDLGISHPQLRDSMIKYKKEEKENIGTTQILKDNLESIKKRKKNLEITKIDQISKDMDQELYKDHIEKDQNIDPKTYENVVDSLRKQFDVENNPLKTLQEQTKGKNVYLSLDILRGLYYLIYNKGIKRNTKQTNPSRDQLLDFFSDLFQEQKNILR